MKSRTQPKEASRLDSDLSQKVWENSFQFMNDIQNFVYPPPIGEIGDKVIQISHGEVNY